MAMNNSGPSMCMFNNQARVFNTYLLVLCWFWDKILLYHPSWPWILDPPASAFLVLGLYVWLFFSLHQWFIGFCKDCSGWNKTKNQINTASWSIASTAHCTKWEHSVSVQQWGERWFRSEQEWYQIYWPIIGTARLKSSFLTFVKHLQRCQRCKDA